MKKGEVREEEGKELPLMEEVEEEVIFKDRNGFGLALMEANHHLQFKVQPLCIPLLHKEDHPFRIHKEGGLLQEYSKAVLVCSQFGHYARDCPLIFNVRQSISPQLTIK